MPDRHLFTIDPGLDEVAIAHWTVPAVHGLTAQDQVRLHLSSMTMITTSPQDRTSRRLAQIGDAARDWLIRRFQSFTPLPGLLPGMGSVVIELPARGGMYAEKEGKGIPLEAVMRRMQVSMAASGVISAECDRLGLEVWYWPATGKKSDRQAMALAALKGAKASGWAARTYPPDLLDAIAQGLQVMPMFVDLVQGRPLPGVGSILGRAAKAVPGYGGHQPVKKRSPAKFPVPHHPRKAS